MTDEEFLEALKAKKSLAKVLKSSTDILSSETNGKWVWEEEWEIGCKWLLLWEKSEKKKDKKEGKEARK